MSAVRNLRCALLVSGSLLASSLASPALHAQSLPAAPVPPIRTSVDDNGVDVASGHIPVTTPGISIGVTQGSSLDFSQSYTGTGWSNPYDIKIIDTTSTQRTVVMGSSSEVFSASGGSYTNSSGSGSTLTAVTSGSTVTGYVYTLRDGTVINFSIVSTGLSRRRGQI